MSAETDCYHFSITASNEPGDRVYMGIWQLPRQWQRFLTVHSFVFDFRRMIYEHQSALSPKLPRRHPGEPLELLGKIRDILKTASGGDIADA